MVHALRATDTIPAAKGRQFARLFAGLGPELPLDLAVATIAADEQPGLNPKEALATFDDVADGLHMPAHVGIYEGIARLNHHLFTRWGFAGDADEYDHPDNSFINRVVDRRRGLPILMSVLYMEVARRVGVTLDGVGFPAHFVVGTRDVHPRFYVDPFHQGLVLRDEDLRDRLARFTGAREVEPDTWRRFTAPTDTTNILVRINNNLKRALSRRGDTEGALRAVERNMLLAPDCPFEHRDRGLLLAQAGLHGEARVELEVYLNREPAPWDALHVNDLLRVLVD